MQNDTIVTQIEMVYPDGRKMLVGLDYTDYYLTPVPHTRDPQWWATNSEQPALGVEHGEWVVYRTAGGSLSKSKARCEWKGDYIETSFEHRDFYSDAQDPDSANKYRLLFKDWNGDSWSAFTQHIKAWPAHPSFRVIRI